MTSLKLSRSTYILLVALTSAAVGLVETIIPVYVSNPTVATALEGFVPQVGTAIAAYFTTEAGN